MIGRTNLVIVIVIVILAISCKGTQVVSFTNSSTDFSKFSTYRIVPEQEGDEQFRDTSKVNLDLEDIIIEEIEARNYKYHPRADLRIHYRFIANTKTDYNVNTYSGYGRTSYYYNPYSNRYYQPYSVNKRNFYEAILLIELRDRTTGKSVWQGSLDMRYTKKVKDKKNVLPEAVREIFRSYPYVAGSSKRVTPLNE